MLTRALLESASVVDNEGARSIALPRVMRHTKIVATLGPAVASRPAIDELVEAGIDVARLNFSHGDHGSHAQFATWVREAADAQGRTVALLQDLAGPKIRVGALPGGVQMLETGSPLALTVGTGPGSADELPVDYPGLLDDVGVGDAVVLADGRVRLKVRDRKDDHLVAEVIEGGQVSDHCGVSLPDSQLSVPSLTDKDREDLEFGAGIGFDYVAASFVRSSEDLRRVAAAAPPGTPVVAKVELAAAYQNLDDVMSAADGIMVARGDLGVELPLEDIPMVQDEILAKTNAAGLISITATEMLESMVHSSRPTRAEVTDVATAVLAGTDAVMLSAETAIGDHPTRAVRAMARICSRVEEGLRGSNQSHVPFLTSLPTLASAVAGAAVEVAHNLDLATIVGFTETGNTARLLSKYRPAADIVAFSPSSSARRRMALYWGVTPRPFEPRTHTDDMFEAAQAKLLEAGWCDKGDVVVMVAGVPPNQRASTNMLKLHKIT